MHFKLTYALAASAALAVVVLAPPAMLLPVGLAVATVGGATDATVRRILRRRNGGR